MEPIISLHNITKVFKDEPHRPLTVIKDISMEINKGEFFIFLGPSGSGKSTLLRIMSGLEKEYEGKVVIDPSISKEDISFVFQQFALLPWLTVYENIRLGLVAKKMSEKERHIKIMAELERFGLHTFKDSHIHELSGGMRQRVGIARAFVRNPKIIFMDEPFSELDSFIAEELREQLLTIWKNSDTTIIMVSHNIEEALKLSDRIAILSTLPGTLKKVLTNALPRPRQVRVPEFFAKEDEIYALIKPEIKE